MIARIYSFRHWAACLTILCALACTIQPTMAELSAQAVVVWVMPDGSVKIDGKQFSDPAKLKVKIAEIKRINPSPEFHVRVLDKNTPFKTIGAAILLLQKAGATLRVGFITESRQVPQNEQR